MYLGELIMHMGSKATSKDVSMADTLARRGGMLLSAQEAM
jgi:hypothetical protein